MRQLGRWARRAGAVVSLIVFLATALGWAVLDRRPGWAWWTRVERIESGRELAHGYYITIGQGRLKAGELRGNEPRLPSGLTARENVRLLMEQEATRHQERLERARDLREPGSAREREHIAVLQKQHDAMMASLAGRLRQLDVAMVWLTPGFHWQRIDPIGTPPPATWEWGGVAYRRSGGGISRSRSLSVPMWMVLCVTAVLPVVMTMRVTRRARRRRNGWCGRCGYDLRASTEGCPECGEGMAAGSAVGRHRVL